VQPKPRGLDRRYGEQFDDATVVDAYAARPPYLATIDPLLIELAGGPDAHLLDLGCGPGELARRLAPKLAAVTAIDQSERMIASGRALPGGDAPNLTWIAGRVEDVTLAGPYSAALASQSFHWFDWPVLLQRLPAWVPSRRLILAERRAGPAPWSDRVAPILARFSTNRDFEPFDLVDALTARRILTIEGNVTLSQQRFTQPLEDYVTSFHSMNGFSRDRMPAAEAAAFDDAVREAVAPHAKDGAITLPVVTRIVWGRIPGAF
jgi:SAM-dependent methyltransferase